MASIQELSANIDIEVKRDKLLIYRLGREQVVVPFSEMPEMSRACSIAKDSPEYQAWLERKRLA